MQHKPILIASFVLMASVALWLVVRNIKSHTPVSRYTIGILQTASHPALDATRQGFVDTLVKALGNQISFIRKNGEGGVATLNTLAHLLFIDNNTDAFFAIATPAVQALGSLEYERPVFIAAVTDPYALGIMDNRNNMCGTTDMNNIPGHIDAVMQLLPTIKSAALVYNNGEINSLSQVELLEKALIKHAIVVQKVGITSEIDMLIAVEHALRTTDILIAPTDNMVANAITIIAELARVANKPLIVSDNLLVKYGALMSYGVDYYGLGEQTGKQALAVLLKHKNPAGISIVPGLKNTLVINKERLNNFNLTVPYSFGKNISIVTTVQK